MNKCKQKYREDIIAASVINPYTIFVTIVKSMLYAS